MNSLKKNPGAKKNSVRLQKFLADCGIASRRRAEVMMTQGLVAVNEEVMRRMGTTVDPEHDIVTVRGKRVARESAFVYYLVNKPRGILSSAKDERGRKSVVSLVPASPRVVPVGRLDVESTGLIILTNDGALTYKLTHPKFRHEKEYIVILDRPVQESDLKKLKRGIRLQEGIARARAAALGPKTVSVILTQGWKRQIRRMFEELGYETKKLTRIREGKLTLDHLQAGEWRKIKKSDII